MSNSKENKMVELIKEAHDHGYSIAMSNLGWDQAKSWDEFRKQNNILDYEKIEQAKQSLQSKAISLKTQGFSLRHIASILGMDHPQKVKNLINWKP